MEGAVYTLDIAEQIYQLLSEEYAKPLAWDIALDYSGNITLRNPDSGEVFAIRVKREEK